VIEWRVWTALVTLVAVPVVGAFLLWAERRRRRDLGRFVAEPLVGVLVPEPGTSRRWARNGVLMGAIGCVVLGLAGPKWGFQWEEVRREGIDLVVALDTSRSMLATDVRPDRLTRAKLALRDLLGELEGDRVALVAFAGTAFVQCPLTLDQAVFEQSLDAVDTTLIPRGGTSLTAAIEASLGAFEGRQSKHQAIILITDGEDHEGDVMASATEAAERGVKVYTVGIGTADGELIPLAGGTFLKDRAGRTVKSRLDEETLQNVAVETGGVYVRASGPSLGLPDLYRDYVATMEDRELATTLERRWRQRYQWPLALALLLLVAGPWIGERRRRSSAALVLLALSAGATPAGAWPEPTDPAREASQLYDRGEFEEAAQKYNEAIIDAPDSPRLHFNLGTAEYRREQWERAATAFEATLRDARDAPRTARAAYNLGNVRFREGEAVAGSEPQTALDRWAAALVAYRRAMGADPTFEDVKYNYQLVRKRIEQLREQLEKEQDEEQQEPQDEQAGPQEQQETPGEQGEPPSESTEEQQEREEESAGQQPGRPDGEAEEQPQAEANPDEAAASEERPQPTSEAGGAAAPTDPDEGMTPAEAMALLDSQRDEELDPREMQQGTVAGELPPERDW
jgi:Ca-activated chloride channel family protein